jgi:leucyl-tRNA synthetase
MARTYDVVAVEAKWQAHWLDAGTYEVDNDDPRERFYALCMYPYPSGAAHQGHVRNYTFGDLVVRYQTMLGKAVLTPFGFDSFGLPAENAAIKAGSHPRLFTEARIAELKSSVRKLGAVYDWRREVRSHDPEYIKWNQVIFLASSRPAWPTGPRRPSTGARVPDGAGQRAGLADGTCERSGDLVERRDLEQWFFRSPTTPTSCSTTSTPRLARAGEDHAAQLDRPFRGCRVRPARGEGSDKGATGLHDPADTGFGMTYAVVAPEHPMLEELTTDDQRASVDRARERATSLSDLERTVRPTPASGSRSAAPSPAASSSTPSTASGCRSTWPTTCSVGYGTGAIMAVPAEDERDWAFATVHGLPIVRTVAAARGLRGRRLQRRRDARSTRASWTASTSPRPRRPPRSGSRTKASAPQGQLPPARLAGLASALLGLPDPGRLLPHPRPRARCRSRTSCRSWRPTTSSSCRPASRHSATHEGFRNTTCPICGGPARRETDTMDTFVDSSWYFLRFCDPWTPGRPFDPAEAATGCRSTSTSAASSTPSCTCSTRASTPGPDRHRPGARAAP